MAERIRVPMRTIFLSQLPSDADDHEVVAMVKDCTGASEVEVVRVAERYDIDSVVQGGSALSAGL